MIDLVVEIKQTYTHDVCVIRHINHVMFVNFFRSEGSLFDVITWRKERLGRIRTILVSICVFYYIWFSSKLTQTNQWTYKYVRCMMKNATGHSYIVEHR